MANYVVQTLPVLVDQDQDGAPVGFKLRDGREVLFPRQDSTGALVSATGGVLALTEVTPYVTLTATGTPVAGVCELAGYDCTVAAGNITIYDNTSAAGTVIVPTTALTVGRVEFAYKRALLLGCHVVLSGAATVNVLVG